MVIKFAHIQVSMSRATRFKIYRVLVIASIILIIPLLFIVGVTLPYLFNTIKVSFPEIAIGKDVERYITEKELDFKNTDAKARKKINRTTAIAQICEHAWLRLVMYSF